MWPDWAIYRTLGNFLKALATINLPKTSTFFGNFCKGVNFFNLSSEIIFGNFYRHLAIFSGHTDGSSHVVSVLVFYSFNASGLSEWPKILSSIFVGIRLARAKIMLKLIKCLAIFSHIFFRMGKIIVLLWNLWCKTIWISK